MSCFVDIPFCGLVEEVENMKSLKKKERKKERKNDKSHDNNTSSSLIVYIILLIAFMINKLTHLFSTLKHIISLFLYYHCQFQILYLPNDFRHLDI